MMGFCRREENEKDYVQILINVHNVYKFVYEFILIDLFLLVFAILYVKRNDDQIQGASKLDDLLKISVF